MKKALITIASVIVAGIVIAGETLGWSELLKSVLHPFIGAKIVTLPVTRASATEFFAGEKVWFVLKDIQAQRVYWLFDESDKIAAIGAQVQYAFPFDGNAADGAVAYHRVDAFFKDGDHYRTASASVPILNTHLQPSVALQDSGLKVAAQNTLF